MILVVVAVVFVFLVLMLLIWSPKRKTPFGPATDKRHSAQKAAGTAALERFQVWQTKQRERQEAYQRKRLAQDVELVQQTTSRKQQTTTTTSPSYEQEILYQSLPVFDNGITVFRHLPQLPQAQVAANMMRRLAQEFMPILRQRGYHVRSVSEFCCCGDGLDYELGGHVHCHEPYCEIAGHEAATVLGYNKLAALPRNSHCTIHLRLRLVHNHNYLLDYQQVAESMAHEMAHCVHRHHESSFYQLLDEIWMQYAEMVMNNNTDGMIATTRPSSDEPNMPYRGIQHIR